MLHYTMFWPTLRLKGALFPSKRMIMEGKVEVTMIGERVEKPEDCLGLSARFCLLLPFGRELPKPGR